MADADAVGTIHASKGNPPRVRRAGTRDWVEAPVGTKVYRGDSLRSEGGESSLRHADGTTSAVRRGSLVEIEDRKPPKKVKRKPIESGEASFSAKDAGDALASAKKED